MERRSDYYRTIARLFLKERGAPLVLSSGDMNQIRAWENKGIPLHAVTEGIRLHFRRPASRNRTRGGVLPLSACSVSVEKAYDMFRSRRVGSDGRRISRRKKYRAALERIESFLQNVTPEAQILLSVILEARDIFRSDSVDEDLLEKLENRLEEIMAGMILPSEMGQRRSAAAEDYPELKDEERERIAFLFACRDVRDKYGIPYLSVHYYE
ncbi:MAG: hypothetical protein KKD56_03350 [Acidobacteria bacterium]|nr:hypothetical protein [Acidobacteriota bacterium]MCG2816245.1 hypothetical protein [Candidatus Aminicenantes bacterium]MBU1338084.1 hypothetical protein [Acidobacteriota bacterium]MBU4203592.1 hypothetical protein [Acidobacteriota bacterium]MBU4254388.1 hypothetical protein [Acidobacteriota bacterium]